MFCCCFLSSYLFSYFIVLMIPVNIYPTFLRQIFRIGRIMATDDPPEISFSVLQGTLPGQPIFTARCCASAVLANPTQPMGQPNPWTSFLCPSVCLSQVGVLLKRLNVGSHKQHHRVNLVNLVFWCQRSPRNSIGVTLYGGTKCR